MLVAYQPVQFTLEPNGTSDARCHRPASLEKLNSRSRGGGAAECAEGTSSNRLMAGHEFTADPERVAFWRAWLISNGIFTDDSQVRSILS
ncbi:hypothetical protein HBB16_13865 [Pseudonocardia sp. MCCB 268]|nr:hypothetical protein [Pseudonocardia cytotoxica]